MVTTTAPRPVAALSPSALRLLRTAGFVSNFDRFCIAPMLVLIGPDLGVPLATVVLAASGYYLAYGLMQPVWGAASDRWGRVRVMRVSLAGAAPAALVSALAPDAPVLIGARVLTGACFAAAIPASLTYVGDTVPAAVRQRPLSELMTAFALGTALATAVAGALAHYLTWRPVFALPGILAGVLAVGLRRLPEPARPRSGSLLAPFGTVLRSRWQWYVMAVALLEGAVLLGFLTYLAPALEAHGVPVALAGAVAALYGAGATAASQAVRRLVGRWSPAALIAAGGARRPWPTCSPATGSPPVRSSWPRCSSAAAGPSCTPRSSRGRPPCARRPGRPAWPCSAWPCTEAVPWPAGWPPPPRRRERTGRCSGWPRCSACR
ncbi:MFS transporter [Streptomyces misionensis]|uniref:MFS transporter n=1 Tax=Streptomyces misionensis TaxID=67331 RepID=UPI0033B410D9